MIIPKEMLLQAGDGLEVIQSEIVEQPILICPTHLYEKIKEGLENDKNG